MIINKSAPCNDVGEIPSNLIFTSILNCLCNLKKKLNVVLDVQVLADGCVYMIPIRTETVIYRAHNRLCLDIAKPTDRRKAVKRRIHYTLFHRTSAQVACSLPPACSQIGTVLAHCGTFIWFQELDELVLRKEKWQTREFVKTTEHANIILLSAYRSSNTRVF